MSFSNKPDAGHAMSGPITKQSADAWIKRAARGADPMTSRGAAQVDWEPTVGEVVSVCIWRKPKAHSGIVLTVYTDGDIRILPSTSEQYANTLILVAQDDKDALKAKQQAIMADSLIVYPSEFSKARGGK